MADYKSAGVDIELANRIVQRIRQYITKGHTGFASVNEINGHSDTKIVTSTDGVGTKSKLLNTIDFLNAPYILGQDLVGMVVNDIITTGAIPLYFLDYIAMNTLHEDYVVSMVETISDACRRCDMGLVGGETAEMPNHYSDRRHVDLVGFGVGKVESDYQIHGLGIRPGDPLIGIRSSGPHANGYSLINKLVESATLQIFGKKGGITQQELMEPTRLYYPILKDMAKHLVYLDNNDPLSVRAAVRGYANITGGGMPDNIPRMFQRNDLQACLDYDMVRHMRLPIFDKIMEAGQVSEDEMFKTFNMGIGFVACVAPQYLPNVIMAFKDAGEQVYLIGDVDVRPENEPSFVIG